jgi:hypothetical protein
VCFDAKSRETGFILPGAIEPVRSALLDRAIRESFATGTTGAYSLPVVA